MPNYRDGTANPLSFTNPGAYIDQILPASSAAGVPTNLEAFVGVASWGKVNSIIRGSSPDDIKANLGIAQVRASDLATHILAAMGQGNQLSFLAVRVTDGTDTASQVVIPANGGTATALCTGSLGDQIRISFGRTSAQDAYAALVFFPGRTTERFDNIREALYGLTATPGAGYQSVPTMSLPVPGTQGGIRAIAQASLVAVSATLVGGSGGLNHAVNDVVSLGAGVTVKVTAISGGGAKGPATTVQLVNTGSITSGVVPAAAGNQISTTGTGTGLQAVLSFGLGPATVLNSGFGYPTSMNVLATLSGGNPTTPGSYAPIMNFWAAAAYAINNGTSQRGPSDYVVFGAGASTGVPDTTTIYSLSGGTDGDTGVTSATLLGQDFLPHTGMFALRSAGADAFELCDCFDEATWNAQLQFAISEASYAVCARASGDSIAEAVADRLTQGIDDPSIKILVGDWPTFYDTMNGVARLVSPAAITLGMFGNLAPQNSPINKALINVNATETSDTGVETPSADESLAQTGGVDFIGRSEDLNEDFFSLITGRNTSSNTNANGDEYTRLTNFIIRILEKAAVPVVGRLQSSAKDDPTRNLAFTILTSLFATMALPQVGSGGYGMIDYATVVCDLSNNPADLRARGFLFAYARVVYLNVVRYFVVQLDANGNIAVSVQPTQPTAAQFA